MSTLPFAVTVRRNASARRLRLTVDPRNGAVRLTLPARASERKARVWLETHRDWVEAQLAALPMARPIVPGAMLPFRGRDLRIDWCVSASRQPRIEGDMLVVGGPPEGLARRVLSWARGEALAVLDPATRALAGETGRTVRRVGVGDPRGRWGSCSTGGDIRYSWRLILAPPDVLDATVAHEVAHLLHMNHGPAFHEAERRLLGRDPAPARAWLRANGAALHWIGREA